MIFDLDETLTTRKLKYGNKEYEISYDHLKPIINKIDISEDMKYDLLRWGSYSLQTLIDPKINEVFDSMRVKKLKLLSCTACASKHRFLNTETINRIGLNFDDAFDFSEKVLEDIPIDKGEHPVYYHGFIFSNGGKNKGIAIKSFVDTLETKPQHIIMVDDRKINLANIEEALKNTGIKFIPIYINNNIILEDVPEKILKDYINKILALYLNKTKK